MEEREVPVFESVVQFQQQFGGLHLVNRWTGNEVSLGLFGRNPRNYFDQLRAFRDGERWLFYVGTIEAAPDNFYIDQDGVLCFGAIPFASNVVQWVEFQAVENELADADELDIRIGEILRLTTAQMKRLESLPLPKIEIASDRYNVWWADEGIRIARSWVWGSPDSAWLRTFVSDVRAIPRLVRMLADVLELREDAAIRCVRRGSQGEVVMFTTVGECLRPV